MSECERINTIVIGGGQAGLATGYHLARLRRDFVVLDARARVGDVWRNRRDSLRLFTPSKFNALPGLPFPADDRHFPRKDELADYLEAYAVKFDLPIRLSAKAEALSRDDGHFVVHIGARRLLAENVVVATGAYHRPYTPSFAADFDPAITQLHSADYRNPGQVAQGDVLVVGAGNTGAEIALELAAAGRRVWLSGRSTGRIPTRLGPLSANRLSFWFISNVLSVKTPIGRKLKKKALIHGAPLVRVKPQDLVAAGIRRVSRVTAVDRGKPRLEDGTALDVAAVVWATGFRPNFAWIQLSIIGNDGYPRHRRGVVEDVPGLYFVGLLFQHALASALIGGVGADARYIVEHIGARAGQLV